MFSGLVSNRCPCCSLWTQTSHVHTLVLSYYVGKLHNDGNRGKHWTRAHLFSSIFPCHRLFLGVSWFLLFHGSMVPWKCGLLCSSSDTRRVKLAPSEAKLSGIYISLHQPDTSISITCPCIFFLTLFIHLFVCSKNSFNVLLCYRGYQHLKCVLWTNGRHFVIWSNNCTFNKAHCRKIL